MRQIYFYVLFILILTLFINEQANAQVESPLKQFRQGIPISEIKCAEGHQLVVKKSDNTPACVFPTTVSILFQRDWAMPINATLENSINEEYTKPTSSVFAIFYTSGSNHANLELFEKYLRAGDYLFIATPLDQDSDFSQLVQDVTEAKSKVVPGVKVFSFAWYSKIDAIKLHSEHLPQDVDGIIYDYENGSEYSPEYTTDYNETLSLFETASEIAHENNLKLMLTPVFGDTINGTEVEHTWNWTEISSHTDFLVIQFQHYFKDHNSDSLKTRMGMIMEDINSISGTPSFVELSLTAVGGTADEDLKAMQDLEQSGANKFLIFFEPWNTSELEYIFENRSDLLDQVG